MLCLTSVAPRIELRSCLDIECTPNYCLASCWIHLWHQQVRLARIRWLMKVGLHKN